MSETITSEQEPLYQQVNVVTTGILVSTDTENGPLLLNQRAAVNI